MTSVAAPPARGAAPRRRPVRARLLSWLATATWLVLFLTIVAATGVLLFLHRGDQEGSARLANREIDDLLERGEVVEARVPVMQRRWWDYFRITHGVLAATDRRLIFVGVPPEELLPREPEPRELIEMSFPYDRGERVSRHRVFLGTRPGMTISTLGGGGTGASRETFGLVSTELPRLADVLAVLTRREDEIRLAAEAERRAAQAAAAASRKAIYHLVQRGEVLDFIARRYGVSVDSLIAWNGLPSTRITAGRRLLVKPGS